MDLPRLTQSVRRITILNRNAQGDVAPAVIFDRRKKKKKSSGFLRPVERLVRSVADASDAYTGTYLRRHKKSNTKRRDGWLRDLNLNLTRAGRKGAKELDASRNFNF